MSDSCQPEARARVLAVLEAAGSVGIEGHQLCELAHTHAAVRRQWEIGKWFGYVIKKTYVRRNVYRYTLTRREPWHRSPDLSVREARTQEIARLAALREESRAVQRQASLLALMEAR